MKNVIPIKPDASDTRIRDLIFEATQRKSWSNYFKMTGKPAQSETHMKKYRQAIKSLKSLGYNYSENV